MQSHANYCISPWDKLFSASSPPLQSGSTTVRHPVVWQPSQNGSSAFHFFGGYSFGPACCPSTQIISPLSGSNKYEIPPRQQLYTHPSTFSLSQYRDIVRDHYLSTPKPKLGLFFRGGGRVTVAIHIRSGDTHRYEHDLTTGPSVDWPEITLGPRSAYVNSSAALNKCFRFLKHVHGPSTQLHVFSESPFRPFVSEHFVRWHIDGNPLRAFHHLVSADVLVVAYGTYGLMAGYLNQGSVYTYAQRRLSLPNFRGTCV